MRTICSGRHEQLDGSALLVDRAIRDWKRQRTETRFAMDDPAGQDGACAEETRHIKRGGLGVELLRLTDLQQDAAFEHANAISQFVRLLLVVGHENRGDLEAALDFFEASAELRANLNVQGAERLVEQQDGRFIRERPRQSAPVAAGRQRFDARNAPPARRAPPGRAAPRSAPCARLWEPFGS